MIEITKFMFLGESTYYAEAPPRRLRNNPLWSKDRIKQRAEELLDRFDGHVMNLIEHLRSVRNGQPAPRIA
jgi:hypothetical protein